VRLEKLGYELERGKHGQPEIKGCTKEYLEASSPRREQIKDHLCESGIDGAGAAQVAVGVIADAAVLAGDDTRTFCHGFTRMTTDKTEQMKRPRPNAVAFFDSQLTR
jgi:conjugative relaxase-like TrwC/TraI family protein